MVTLRRWITIATALGALATLMLVLGVLALTDIAHGEADLRQEWWVVRSGVLVVGLFVATALATLAKVRRGVDA